MEVCSECNGKLVRTIKPDAPEYFDLVCTACGLIQDTYEYHRASPVETGGKIDPEKIPIDICLLCGGKLIHDEKPQGGRPRYFCDVCIKKRRLKKRKVYDRKYEEKRREKRKLRAKTLNYRGKIQEFVGQSTELVSGLSPPKLRRA